MPTQRLLCHKATTIRRNFQKSECKVTVFSPTRQENTLPLSSFNNTQVTLAALRQSHNPSTAYPQIGIYGDCPTREGANLAQKQ